MLAIGAISSPTVLRATFSCLRIPLQPRSPTLCAHGPSKYYFILQRRPFCSSSRLHFPRTAPPLRKLDPSKSSKDPGVPSFLAELAKDETNRFSRAAERFREQTGMTTRGRQLRLASGRRRKGGGVGYSAALESEAEVSPSDPPPRFREEVLKEDPTSEQPKFEEGIGRPIVWPQIASVGLLMLIIYSHAAEQTNIETRRLSAMFPSPFLVTSEQLRRVRLGMISEKLKKTLHRLKDAVSDLPNSLTYPFLWAYVQLANGYINSSEGKRVAYQICAINGTIWFLWQFRFLKPFMRRNFMHHPLSGRTITFITSMFSHESFIHLLANSFALISFGSAATSYLVKRQQENREGLIESSPRYHFWAMFICAGLFSGLVSHVVSARFVFPRLLAEARASKAAENIAATTSSAFRRVGTTAKEKARPPTRDILPSLGASGAIYATVTITALAYPDAQLFLLFPPIPLPITWGVGFMVTMDIIGIIRGWRLFDHWAHLSGALFGVWYYKYGSDLWNALRAKHAEIQKRKLESPK